MIHEGIDTTRVAPRQGAELHLKKAGLTLRPGDEVVSFVARNLEPYRGIHCFLRMLPLLQQLRPQARVVIVGEEGVSYGAPPPGGGSWKQVLLQELAGRLDLSRIHFVGRVPHPLLHELFRICACHVYLTYPFVLSWSLLEAMACAAVVIGSATAPFQEVIESGRNGLLVDFLTSQLGPRPLPQCWQTPSSSAAWAKLPAKRWWSATTWQRCACRPSWRWWMKWRLDDCLRVRIYEEIDSRPPSREMCD